MKTPRHFISIVTVTRNDFDGLKRTVESVLSQSLAAELIIVDGASEDASVVKYLSGLKSTKHKITWESRRDRGLYHAMNKGLDRATGEFVLFLNSSDTLHNSNVLQEVKAYLDSSHKSWAVGMAVRISPDKKPVAVWEYLDHSEWGLSLGFRTFCHQSVFYKTELAREFRYDEDLLCADHLMNLRFYKEYPLELLPIITTYFQNGGVSSKRNIKDTSKDLRTARKRSDSLILGNAFLDFVVFTTTLVLLRLNGALWAWLRKVLPRLIKLNFGVKVENP